VLYCAHKEHIDKDHVRKLLVSLSGDKECKPMVFADEVMPENNHSYGPTGRIDLCVGTRCDEEDAAYCVTTTTRTCWICHVSFAETKSESISLSKAKSSLGSSEIGQVAQPVLEILSLALPCTRQSEEASSTTTSSSTEKVSDFVVFDHSAMIYTIIGEIKCDNDEAEQQNIEEMLGAWRKHQGAMLGFTCNKTFVLPRVFMVEDNSLFCIPSLSCQKTI